MLAQKKRKKGEDRNCSVWVKKAARLGGHARKSNQPGIWVSLTGQHDLGEKSIIL